MNLFRWKHIPDCCSEEFLQREFQNFKGHCNVYTQNLIDELNKHNIPVVVN
jgi:hypothetical protein